MARSARTGGITLTTARAKSSVETSAAVLRQATDQQLATREALLTKIAAQADALVPDVLGGPRAHEIALTLVQLAAAYAAIVGSENQ